MTLDFDAEDLSEDLVLSNTEILTDKNRCPEGPLLVLCDRQMPFLKYPEGHGGERCEKRAVRAPWSSNRSTSATPGNARKPLKKTGRLLGLGGNGTPASAGRHDPGIPGASIFPYRPLFIRTKISNLPLACWSG